MAELRSAFLHTAVMASWSLAFASYNVQPRQFTSPKVLHVPQGIAYP